MQRLSLTKNGTGMVLEPAPKPLSPEVYPNSAQLLGIEGRLVGLDRRGSANGPVHLADRAKVIRQMHHAACESVLFHGVQLARLPHRFPPCMRQVMQPPPALSPLFVGHARVLPALGPVRIGEWLLALAPSNHQSEPVTKVVHMRGDR